MKKIAEEPGNFCTVKPHWGELDSIKSFNDQISLQDVTDIYPSIDSPYPDLQDAPKKI